MSVVIERIIYCDGCGDTCSGDDRHKTATLIRKERKAWGWIQIGSKDYCRNCAPKHHRKSLKS